MSMLLKARKLHPNNPYDGKFCKIAATQTENVCDFFCSADVYIQIDNIKGKS